MKDFYCFVWKRLGTKNKVAFLTMFLTALINNATVVLVPIVQKKMMEQMTALKKENNVFVWYCIISIAGILITIFEALLINELEINLKRTLQQELLESALVSNSNFPH